MGAGLPVSVAFPEKAIRVPSRAPTRTTAPSSQLIVVRFIVLFIVLFIVVSLDLPAGRARCVVDGDPRAVVAGVPAELNLRHCLDGLNSVQKVGVRGEAVVDVAGAIVGLAV